MSQRINTVIVGGGQAGLAIRYYLKQEGRGHVGLEPAAAVVHAWRHERWNSFTPRNAQLPGAHAGRGIRRRRSSWLHVEGRRRRVLLHCRAEVFSVEKLGDRYLVRTSEDDYEADNVVIATGLYRSPKIPPFSAQIRSSILQIHSSRYRNPWSLPGGAALAESPSTSAVRPEVRAAGFGSAGVSTQRDCALRPNIALLGTRTSMVAYRRKTS